MTTNTTEQELQQKYVELQLLDRQIKELQQQIQIIDEQSLDFRVGVQGLGDIEKTQKGSEILVPVSNGIFAWATLANSSEFLVSVGSNVMVVKSMAETRKLLDEKIATLSQYRDEIVLNLQQLDVHIRRLEAEVRKLMKSREKK